MSLRSLEDRHKVLGTFKEFKGSQCRPVVVEFSSGSIPGRGFFWNKLHLC